MPHVRFDRIHLAEHRRPARRYFVCALTINGHSNAMAVLAIRRFGLACLTAIVLIVPEFHQISCPSRDFFLFTWVQPQRFSSFSMFSL
ncbi:MAG: hypothetical protein U5N55_13870 [Cypionkella sp.]|nr:hypothetical protein [Cypionkella sp.]